MWAKIRKAIQYCSDLPIISKVVVGVAVAAIASAVFWRAVLAAVLWVWHSLAYPVPVPVWLLVLLVLPALCLIGQIVYRRITPGWKWHYKRDKILDTEWHWGYKGIEIVNLRPFCPKDDTELVLVRVDDRIGWQSGWKYSCPTCNGSFLHTEKSELAILKEGVQRQIERKQNSGEWKAGVKKQVDARKSRGHGVPTKRAKERHWREEIQQLIDRATDIGRGAKKAVEWRNLAIETFENLLFDATEEISRFSDRTRSIEDGKNLASAVESGIRYLEGIKHKDGGELR